MTKCYQCKNRDVRTISMDELRKIGYSSSTCFAHNRDIVPFDSINKCTSCLKECEGDIIDTDYNYNWYPRNQNKMRKARTWLNEMIECRHCNTRFCKECQENGKLGEYLSSKLRSSLHVCFDQNA